MTKKEKIKFAYLVTYVVIMIIGVVLYALFKATPGGKIILALDIIILILGALGFAILHKYITTYYCHHCNQEFKANFKDTIFGEDKGVNVGKKMTCPLCGEKDNYKVVR